MSLLKRKKAIGWDIGSSGLRAVELEQKEGRLYLKNVAHLDFKTNIDLSLEDSNSFNLVSESIKKIFHRAKFTTPNSYAVIPGFYSYNKIFNFNDTYSEEAIENWLYQNIGRNAFANSAIFLDWQLMSKKNGTKKVYASAVSQQMIAKIKQLFEESNLKLNGIETSYHSLIRSIFGNDKTNALIIDVGSRYSDLTVVENSIPSVAKSIQFGGEDVTNAISSNLNIDFDQAEQIKRDAQVVNKTILEKLKHEISQLLNGRRDGAEELKPEKIILTGGELKHPQNCELFKKHFNINSYQANPWGRILYHHDLKSYLDQLTPNFAVAIGSAMKIL